MRRAQKRRGRYDDDACAEEPPKEPPNAVGARRRHTRRRAPGKTPRRRFARDATSRTPRRSGAPEERRRARAALVLWKTRTSHPREARVARVPRTPRSRRAPTRPNHAGRAETSRRQIFPEPIIPSRHERDGGMRVRPRRASRRARGSRGTVWGANEGVAHGMFTRKEARGRCRAGCKCGAIFRGKRDDLDRSERGRREKSEILQSESQTRSTACRTRRTFQERSTTKTPHRSRRSSILPRLLLLTD